MKYKAMIGAMALTLGLATTSHAQQVTSKDTVKKATVSTGTKKHHRRHKKSGSAIKATAAKEHESVATERKEMKTAASAKKDTSKK